MSKLLSIQINELEFKAIIGILPWERKKKQKIIINITFKYIYDNNYFIDYSEVVKLIKRIIKEKKFKLLEEAIIYCERILYKTYKIEDLRIKISKPNILKNTIVSLSNP